MEASQHVTDLRRDTTMCGDPKAWYPMRVTYSRELSGYSLKQEAHELLHYRASLPFWRRKKQRQLIFIHSLAQRTNQETSTLTKASPYMERMQLKIAETDDFKSFGKVHEAFALRVNLGCLIAAHIIFSLRVRIKCYASTH